MSTLHERLSLQAARFAPETLLKRMGYSHPRQKTFERLERVLADPGLGLSTPDYDFHFASRGFAEALCRAAEVEPDTYLPAIEEIAQWHHEEATAFKPWLFVDTGFTRSERPGSPLFALAAMESKRRVTLPADTFRLPWEQQLQRAQQTVRWHMRESDGELPLWGRIQRYLFWYGEDRAVELTVDGDVAGEALHVGRAHTHLSVNGRQIAFSGSDANNISPRTGDPHV